MEGVQRHAVAEVVQRDGQRGGRRALVLVHGLAGGARLAGRAGDVEQDQHREVAAAAEAVDVDGFVGRRPGERLDAGLDRGVDVDVVALRLPAAAVEADAEAGERTPQRMAVGHAERDVPR